MASLGGDGPAPTWPNTRLDKTLSAMGQTMAYLPYIVPFALATVIGGIDCAESAASVGDDIVCFTDESRSTELARFHTLRQQWERKGQKEFRALADYVAPLDSGREDYVGAFAVTAGVGVAEFAAKFEAERRKWERSHVAEHCCGVVTVGCGVGANR